MIGGRQAYRVSSNVRSFQQLPPVYGRVALRSLAGTASALLRQNGENALAAAEHALRRVYPDRAVALCDSGTSALTLALRASSGTTVRNPVVALPAYACPDIGTAAIGAHFQIVLYDVDPRTLEPDFESLRDCLAGGATHVVAVHLFGRLVDVAGISALANEYGAVIIEDAAQHAGATRDGARGGGVAAWGVLSFGRGKGLNAGGGGAVLAPSAEAEQLRTLLAPGGSRGITALLAAAGAEILSSPWMYAVPASLPTLRLGETVYHEPRPPRSMSHACAQLLVAAIADEPQELAYRRGRAARYHEELAGVRTPLFTATPQVESGALREPVTLSGTIPRSLLRMGVIRSYPRTLLNYPEIRQRLATEPGVLLGAESLAQTTWTLPTHRLVTDTIQDRIIRELSVLH